VGFTAYLVVGGLSDPLYLSNNIGEPTPKNERLALTNKLLRFLETHNSSPRIGPTFIVLEVGPPPPLNFTQARGKLRVNEEKQYQTS
jgi:hypothetical protein